MARKIKIATVCSAGMGSGFLFMMSVEAAAQKLGYDVDVQVVDSSGVAGMDVDIYVTTPLLAKGLGVPEGKPVVTVSSFTDRAEMEEKLGPVLQSVSEGR